MSEVREKISNLTEDFVSELYYDHEEFRKECLYEMGQEEKAQEIAVAMLKENIAIETIAKVTSLTKEEIESLQD